MDKSDTDRLREDLAEVLTHQYDTAKHQQDVRDRWYRYYLITVGAILSLFGALLTAALRTDVSKPELLSQIIGKRDFLYYTIPVLVSIPMGLTVGLGVLFLGIYMTQIVSYHLNYLAIARVYECYLSLHSPEIARRRLPNPFVFTYGRRQSTESDAEKEKQRWYRFPVRMIRQIIDPQLWAADFWSNCVPLFLNSMCLAVFFVLWFLRPLVWPFTIDHWIRVLKVFTVLFACQIALRQLILILATKFATKNFEQRWPQVEGNLIIQNHR